MFKIRLGKASEFALNLRAILALKYGQKKAKKVEIFL